MSYIDFEFDIVVLRCFLCGNGDNWLLFILNDSLILCDFKFFYNLSFGFMSLNNDLFLVDLSLDFYGNRFIGYGFFMFDWYWILMIIYSFLFDI